MSYWLGVIGSWLISDALYSYALYTGQCSQSWRGEPQTWAKDHWIRLVRLLCGIGVVIIGWMGE